jgi:prophage regulatory protein
MSVTPSGPCFLRLREVCAIVALGRSEVYRLMHAGQFPAAVRVGPNTTRWVDTEVHAWVAEQAEKAPRVTELRRAS